MKTLVRTTLVALATYGCLGLTPYVASAGDVPNGRPFRYLHSRIDALQIQIDTLIGDVSSLKEWKVEAQAALDQLKLDSEANAAAIALLEAEIANVKSILATKQDIISGTCPDGQFVYEITSSPAGITCRADMGANGLVLDTVQVSKGIPGNSSEILTAECSAGTVPTGGSYEAGPGLDVASADIDANGFAVDVTNPTPDGITLNVTATCLGIAAAP